MRVYVESVKRRTTAPAEMNSSPGGFTPGERKTSVEIVLRAISESEADALAWESAVGKTLSAYGGADG